MEQIDASSYWSCETYEDNSPQYAGKDYYKDGISHQAPSGQLLFGPLNRPSLMLPARKDGKSCSDFTLYNGRRL
jgi:hypothetical protein